MKRLLFWVVLTAFSLSTFASTITMADPTIFYENGYFYLTGTSRVGSGFNMYRSTDLVHWTAVGNAKDGLALWKEDTYGTGNFWAPQIFKHNDKYYFAYASDEQIGIAESDSPMGPFKQQDIHCITNTTKQIDPFLFRDDDGTVYLYYVRLDGSNSLYVAKMKEDMSDISTDPTFCLRATDNTWEHTKNYTTYKVTEGPTVIKDGGYYFLLYSCNDYHDIDYAVGYAYSKSPTGPWTKVNRPFLSRHNTGMNGSGHGDLFQDGEGQWYYVFHVHASNSDVGNRRTAVVPITITDDPKNKFVPDPSRIVLLDNAAPTTQKFPTGDNTVEQDGIHYLLNTTNATAAVTFGDAVLFNDYSGEVTIPASVKKGTKNYRVNTIGSGAFHNCTRLTRLVLPSGITTLSDYAFENCSIREIQMSSNCANIGMRCFALCDKLQDVVCKRGTPATIAEDVFSATAYSKAKLWVPANRESTYAKNEVWSKFGKISGIPTGTPTYDMQVGSFFYNILDENRCAVTCETSSYYTYRGPQVVVPDTVEYEGTRYLTTQIAKSAFRECHLIEQLEVNALTDTIASYACYNCYDLTSVKLPAALTYIGTSAFYGCSSLTAVTCLATTPPEMAARTCFSTTAFMGTLYVPEGSKTAYEADVLWCNFQNIEEIPATAITPLSAWKPETQSDNIYTLDGKYAGTRLAPLRPGVYVRGGKKVVK
ncbi:MAG: family 43 glycosylhydrolase [Bacteroidaceae bacterium]|nr:family 43 glycosylhydrolase [Bacteroidaceae bacterium]